MEYNKDYTKNLNILKEELVLCYGEELTNDILNQDSRFLSLRVNTQLSTKQEILDFFNKNNIEFESVDFYENAFVIKNKDKFYFYETSIFKEGKIYLQSLSSMLPAILLNPKNDTDILDMTAAPGGKTTLINNLAPKSRITACENNKIRAEKLRYNTKMQNAKNVYVMQIDSTKLEDYYRFDSILLDAPCSGSGTILLNDVNSYKYFSKELIKNSSIIQKKLLSKAINILKKGNTMVYSTCSILPKENDEVIDEFIKKGIVEVVPINIKNIPLLPNKISGTICVKPTKYYEGFYVALLRKIK